MIKVHKQSGASFIELLLFLVVSGLVISLGLRYKDTIWGWWDSGSDVRLYTLIFDLAHDGYSGVSSYDGIDTEWIINTEELPKDSHTDTEIFNSSDGSVTLTSTGSGNRQLLLKSEDVSSGKCEKVIRGMDNGTISIGTGGSTTNIKASRTDEISPDALQDACKASDSLTINFVR